MTATLMIGIISNGLNLSYVPEREHVDSMILKESPFPWMILIFKFGIMMTHQSLHAYGDP